MYRDIKKGLYLPDIEGIQKTRYVKDMFGSISPRYDFLNWIMTLGMHHKWRQTASDIACMNVSGDASSGLDIASGTGDFAFQVIEHPVHSLIELHTMAVLLLKSLHFLIFHQAYHLIIVILTSQLIQKLMVFSLNRESFLNQKIFLKHL